MAAVPVEISVIPSRAYRRGAGKKVKVCIIPLHTEKRIIYPPSFVIPSNPFIIEVSMMTPRGGRRDTSFLCFVRWLSFFCILTGRAEK